MPSGTDTSTARPKPSSTRWVVAQRSSKSSPLLAMSAPALTTAAGDGRNVESTAPLTLSTTQARSGIANDSTASVQRADAEIGVRKENSGEADGLSPARRGNGAQAGRPRPDSRFGEPLLGFQCLGGPLVGRVRRARSLGRTGHCGAAFTNWSSNSPSSDGRCWASPVLTMKSTILFAWKSRCCAVTPGVNASRFCWRVKIVVPAS